MPSWNRALIVFARKPEAGRVKTRLVPLLGEEGAAALYRCMLEDTLRKAAALPGLKVWLFHAGRDDAPYFREMGLPFHLAPQEEGDLGERMAAAFRTVFAAGATAAVIVGTDSPDLPAARVEEGFGALAGADVVFGPAVDGGYYLLGLKELHPDLAGKTVCLLSGGNIDVKTISRVVERGLLAAGRYLKLKVELEDVPGSLARLAADVARTNSNIFHITHDRRSIDLPLGRTEVLLELETRGEAHIVEVVAALKACGYSVTVVR